MKLTKGMKEDIKTSILKEAFTKKQEDLTKIENQLAVDMWEFAYGEYKALMLALPTNAFQWYSSFDCRWVSPGGSISSGISMHFGMESADRTKRMPGFKDNYKVRCIPDSDPLYKRYTEYQQLKFNLQQERKELTSELTRVLEGCTTDKKLMEVWPEGAKWIVPVVGDQFHPPAIIDPTNLNAKLCKLIGKTSPTCEEKK